MTATVYCLVPVELADEVLEPLRRHYADDPSVEVIVDRRMAQRRSGADRRRINVPVAPDVATQRSGQERRKVSDRRSPQIPRRLAPLPDAFAPVADAISWAQRLPAVSRGTEALQLHDLVALIKEGDAEAPTELYWRLFERVYTRLRTLLGRYSRPDRHMREVFGCIFDRLDEFDPSTDHPSFDDWLYAVVEAYAEDLPTATAPDPLVKPEDHQERPTWAFRATR